MHRTVRFVSLAALATLLAVPARAGEETPDPVHHPVVQKKVGFYATFLPPGYGDEANAEKRWPVCVLLGETRLPEEGAAQLADTLGREGVIYVVPRPAHETTGFAGGLRGGGGPAPGRTWSTRPDAPEDVDRAEVEKLAPERLFADFVAECVKDVRARERADDRPAVIVGWGEGARLAHRTAAAHPDVFRAYFAYAGWYRDLLGDDAAAAALKEHGVFPVLVHMQGDARVESRDTRDLAAFLAERGVDHSVSIFAGGGHGFTSKVTRAAQEFVAGRCRGEKLPPLKGELVVTAVADGSEADWLGLNPGDVITSYNGHAVANRDDLAAAMTSVPQGQDRIPITFVHEGEKIEDVVGPGPLGAECVDR